LNFGDEGKDERYDERTRMNPRPRDRREKVKQLYRKTIAGRKKTKSYVRNTPSGAEAAN